VTNRAILDTVLALRARRVLDIGCGEGWLGRALGAEGVAVTGIDAVDSLIAEARRLGGATFAVSTASSARTVRGNGRAKLRTHVSSPAASVAVT